MNKKIYFTRQVDKAIEKYNNIPKSNHDERNKLFEDQIYVPLRELIKNVIVSFNFHVSCNEDIEDLINECMYFIMSKLDKFQYKEGKAFSYFSITCKNYLIQKSKKHNKHKIDTVFYDNNLNNNINEYSIGLYEESNIDFDSTADKLKFLEYMKAFYSTSKKQNDKNVSQAIIYIYENSKLLNEFEQNKSNKKAAYFMIKEIVNIDTKQLTRIVNKIKIKVFNKYRTWLSEG
jgi:hypothetical protein